MSQNQPPSKNESTENAEIKLNKLLRYMEQSFLHLKFQDNSIQAFAKRLQKLIGYVYENTKEIKYIAATNVLSEEYDTGWHWSFNPIRNIRELSSEIKETFHQGKILPPYDELLNVVKYYSENIEQEIAHTAECFLGTVDCYAFLRILKLEESDINRCILESAYYKYMGFVQKSDNYLMKLQFLIDALVLKHENEPVNSDYIGSKDIKYSYKIPRSTLQGWQERSKVKIIKDKKTGENLYPKQWLMEQLNHYKPRSIK